MSLVKQKSEEEPFFCVVNLVWVLWEIILGIFWDRVNLTNILSFSIVWSNLCTYYHQARWDSQFVNKLRNYLSTTSIYAYVRISYQTIVTLVLCTLKLVILCEGGWWLVKVVIFPVWPPPKINDSNLNSLWDFNTITTAVPFDAISRIASQQQKLCSSRMVMFIGSNIQ